jgi:hypothetical protein
MSREGSLRRIELYTKQGKKELLEAEKKTFKERYETKEEPKAKKTSKTSKK